jgi:hypothetical protein
MHHTAEQSAVMFRLGQVGMGRVTAQSLRYHFPFDPRLIAGRVIFFTMLCLIYSKGNVVKRIRETPVQYRERNWDINEDQKENPAQVTAK